MPLSTLVTPAAPRKWLNLVANPGGIDAALAVNAPDDAATLLAAGILAYVGETMLHEAVGHGGACLAGGAHITLLAPLFMRCSDSFAALTAAGPAANIAGAFLYWCVLRFAPPRSAIIGLLLWLSFAFNALVASGYLFVGASAEFGDWPALFDWVSPSVFWRLPAAVIAAAGVTVSLFLAAGRYRALASHGEAHPGRLRRRTHLPAAGAAVVACLAEIVGGRAQIMPLLLAVGCTLGSGLGMGAIEDSVRAPLSGDRDLGPVFRSPALIGAAFVVGLVFVAVIGPGLVIQK